MLYQARSLRLPINKFLQRSVQAWPITRCRYPTLVRHLFGAAQACYAGAWVGLQDFCIRPVFHNCLIFLHSWSNGKKATQRCKCGYLGDPSGRCRCTCEQVQRYRNRISGPLLDRIDMYVEVPRLSFDDMQGAKGEASSLVRERVTSTRNIQLQRNNTLNSQLTHQQIDDVCALNKKTNCYCNR